MKYYLDLANPGWIKLTTGVVIDLPRYVVTDFRPPHILTYRARKIVLEDCGNMVWLKNPDLPDDRLDNSRNLIPEERDEVLFWSLKAQHYTGSFR